MSVGQGRPNFLRNPKKNLMPQSPKDRRCPGPQLLHTGWLGLWSARDPGEVSPGGLTVTYSCPSWDPASSGHWGKLWKISEALPGAQKVRGVPQTSEIKIDNI